MKGFAVIAGLFLAFLLCISGYGMAMRDPYRPFALPFYASLMVLILLPFGYWMVARRQMQAKGGLAVSICMILTLGVLWSSLIWRYDMDSANAQALMIWSAVWVIASLPFMRLVVKHIRKRRP